MILIVGGRRQGKTAFAEKRFAKTSPRAPVIADGITDTPDAAFCADIVLHAEDYVRRFPGEQASRFVSELIRRNPHAIVTMTEVGMGVVPLDREERRFRDEAGLAGQKLAAFSDEVFRVVLGIPVRIKDAREEMP